MADCSVYRMGTETLLGALTTDRRLSELLVREQHIALRDQAIDLIDAKVLCAGRWLERLINPAAHAAGSDHGEEVGLLYGYLFPDNEIAHSSDRRISRAFQSDEAKTSGIGVLEMEIGRSYHPGEGFAIVG